MDKADFMGRLLSLPTWERGLKLPESGVFEKERLSLPTWERGLKLSMGWGSACFHTSLPTWERGLKLTIQPEKITLALVAPYVGAWIETAPCKSWIKGKIVAPYVGAWIETALLFDGFESK